MRLIQHSHDCNSDGLIACSLKPLTQFLIPLHSPEAVDPIDTYLVILAWIKEGAFVDVNLTVDPFEAWYALTMVDVE